MPDVFTLLAEDHRKVESLFEEFHRTGDAEVALEICQELTVHALLEEELVYPVLATKVEREAAEDARREHDEAKHLITRIESGIGRGEDVSSAVQELQKAMEHHVEEEEAEIFPKMQAALPELVATLGQDVLERKRDLLSQMTDALSSSQPPSGVGNKATAS